MRFLTYRFSERLIYSALCAFTISIVSQSAIATEADLHKASCEGNISIIQREIDSGVKPSISNLSCAIWSLQKSAARLLIANGVNIDELDIAPYGDHEKASLLMQFAQFNESRLNGRLIEQLKLIIELGANLNLQDAKGETALHKATYGDIYSDYKIGFDKVNLLIKAGADVNMLNKEGRSPLNFALVSHYTSPEIIKLLMDSGASTHGYDPKHKMPLSMIAVINIHESEEDLIINFLSKGYDYSFSDEEGRTHLHYAAYAGKYETIKYLIKTGAKPSVDKEGKGVSSHWMNDGVRYRTNYTREKDNEIVGLLVAAGEDLSQKDVHGKDFLYHYFLTRLKKLPTQELMDDVDYFVSNGAIINNADGRSLSLNGAILGQKVRSDWDKVIALIEQKGVLVHATAIGAARTVEYDQNGLIITFPLARMSVEQFKYLIKRGANLNLPDDGILCDSVATVEGLKQLIQVGANVNAKCNPFLNAIINRGSLRMVKLLVENGADLSSNNGNLLVVASNKLKIDIIKYLIRKGLPVNKLGSTNGDNKQDTTPLMAVAYNLYGNGSEDTYKKMKAAASLLRREGADPRMENSSGESACSIARVDRRSEEIICY
jgi:ankyrin repeat protein